MTALSAAGTAALRPDAPDGYRSFLTTFEEREREQDDADQTAIQDP